MSFHVDSLHYPLRASAEESNQYLNTVRALADIFMCPVTSYPMGIGLFCEDVDEGLRSGKEVFILATLESEIRALSRLDEDSQVHFSLTYLCLPASLGTLLAYIILMCYGWAHGLATLIVILLNIGLFFGTCPAFISSRFASQ
ncbi:hypothetical protein Ciccas_011083 [Cichlidogyrus casuarinus]|uniref:Uncharacterized protein n=1 Tax=Cichlidogyrus casuarinus TaxID=1844966 RepID=A0ABD2PSP7_9PLAT